MKELLNKIKGLSLSHWCAIGAMILALVSLGFMLKALEVNTISEEIVTREGRVTTIVKESEIPYEKEALDYLLEDLTRAPYFEELTIVKSTDYSYFRLETKAQERATMNFTPPDVVPSLAEFLILTDYGYERELDLTPYSLVQGKPTTLRELLWLLNNTEDVDFYFWLDQDYSNNWSYRISLEYKVVRGIKETRVDEYIRGKSTKHLFKETMAFLKNKANPMWGMPE
jgi:hypothetical protein